MCKNKKMWIHRCLVFVYSFIPQIFTVSVCFSCLASSTICKAASNRKSCLPTIPWIETWPGFSCNGLRCSQSPNTECPHQVPCSLCWPSAEMLGDHTSVVSYLFTDGPEGSKNREMGWTWRASIWQRPLTWMPVKASLNLQIPAVGK